MDQQEIQELLEQAQNYIDDMRVCVEAGEYELLAALEAKYSSLGEHLKQVPVGDVQHFSNEFEKLGQQLTLLRDEMMEKREGIRGYLDQAEQSSHAAKAYLKSSLALVSKKS